jgi:Cleavage and polyadenylation factor 2 C-terminal
VVVNSSHEDIEAFKTLWNDIPRVTREIFVPEQDQTIDVSVTTHQYELRISDEIAKSIKWQTVQNQQVAHIIGSITPAPSPTQQNGTPQPESTALIRPLPTLSPLSLKTSAIPAARPLHVGEVRLLELKTRLQKEGHSAVLGEGVLVCDGVVRVMKDEGGRGVKIEGVVGGKEGMRSLKAFWDVRKAVYEGLAVV